MAWQGNTPLNRWIQIHCHSWLCSGSPGFSGPHCLYHLKRKPVHKPVFLVMFSAHTVGRQDKGGCPHCVWEGDEGLQGVSRSSSPLSTCLVLWASFPFLDPFKLQVSDLTLECGQERVPLTQPVESAQLWHMLKCISITENLILFLKLFAGNIELEQRIQFAQVQMWFAVIRVKWVSLPPFWVFITALGHYSERSRIKW